MSEGHFTEAELVRIHRDSIRSSLEEVRFVETECGLRARISKKSAQLLVGTKLTVGDLGRAALPAGYSPNSKIVSWWNAEMGGFVFIPKSDGPLPLYSRLQQLPAIGSDDTGQSNRPNRSASSGNRDQQLAPVRPTGKHAECGHCVAPLLDPTSQNLGFGPECRRHYSIAELRRMITHGEATPVRSWVEGVTMDQLNVTGKD